MAVEESGDFAERILGLGHPIIELVLGVRLALVDFELRIDAGVPGKYKTLYDQAGLMLRHDSGHWVKAGIEFTDDLMHFCVVVTNQWSDWSLIPLPDAPHDVDLGIHLLRIGQTISIRYRLNQGPSRVARIAAFPYEDITQIGMMCCSPERGGFEAEFRSFQVGAAVASALHV
jgi:regulation of enolase protein 1 (concanavalin A-like superfamily)